MGFTLQYELSYTNILNMLDLAGIPRLAAERPENDPNHGRRALCVQCGTTCRLPRFCGLRRREEIHEIIHEVRTAKDRSFPEKRY